MRVKEKTVVVTGGASGIGRAMVSAFLSAGARGVVVGDIDGDSAERVALETSSERVLGVSCDVTSAASVDRLIDAAKDRFSGVDIFVANAGIGSGYGLDATDDQWRRVLDVNLWGHIHAARALVPQWAERGEGYFVATASAAGLLTQIGDAPYAVSKHACVAFAEWLAVTYGSRGVRVSCLCPMGVDTPLFQGGLGGRGGEDLGTRVVGQVGAVLTSEEVAESVIGAIEDERFLVLPHPEVLEFARRKLDDYDRWLAGMQRLQARAEETLPGD